MNDAVTVALADIDVDYGEGAVVSGLTLDVEPGELLVLLGESGCGKSTTLRAIAGLVRPARGSVAIGGADVTAAPPWRRDVGLVFQQHALFPHLTVTENVAYGLRRRRTGKSERVRRSREVLELVGMESFAHRRPDALSGGQSQRVALARALAPSPKVLLLDEPFSSLDVHLRERMRLEVSELIAEVGVTTVMVTHDQEEALSMGDRIAVMHDGRLLEVGAPETVYRAPRTAYVAGFVGKSNLLRGAVTVAAEGVRFEGGPVSIPLDRTATDGLDAGAVTAVAVKPEELRLSSAPEPGSAWNAEAVVRRCTYSGSTREVFLELLHAGGEPAGVHVRATVPVRSVPVLVGDRVCVGSTSTAVRPVVGP